MHTFHLTGTDSGLTFDVELSPDQRVYCFIGENGVGKTCLLEAMVQVLLFSHVLWRKRERGSDRPFAGLYKRNTIRDALGERMLRVPSGSVDQHDIKRADNWGFASISGLAVRENTAIERCARPVVFVPASQRATIEGIGPAALSLGGDSYTIFASTIGRTLDAVERSPIAVSTVSMWFASRLLVNPSFISGIEEARAEEVAALLELLTEFDSHHFSGVIKRSDEHVAVDIRYHEGQLRFMNTPIDRLASGYVALIKILQEVVASVAAWEAMRDSTDILSSDAIIFIDEIDAHLHPRWQRNLLPFLKRKLPNATFIVTTHSPLVVRDTDPGEAYELVRTDKSVTARRLGSPRDWYLSDVLSQAFHVDLPPVGTQGSEDSVPLMDLLLDFSERVKQFTASRADDERDAAIALHESILARLPDDDPRQQTVAQLRQLLG